MASLVKTDKISTTAGGAQEFTLPAADGTANQHLKTDGSGVLGWASPPTGVALTGSTNTWIPTITGADALAGTANFTYDGNTLDVKNSGTASSINLYCETGNAHYTKIKSGPHSGATSYTLTLPNAPPSVSGQALTATTAGAASWATVGGLTEADTWRLTTSFTGNAAPIASNWERDDTYGFGLLGTGMTESSGIFSFPSTGFWKVTFSARMSLNGDDRGTNAEIWVTVNNTNYYKAARPSSFIQQTGGDVTMAGGQWGEKMLDVTDIANIKVQFRIDVGNSSTSTNGDTDINYTYATFMKLGDT